MATKSSDNRSLYLTFVAITVVAIVAFLLLKFTPLGEAYNPYQTTTTSYPQLKLATGLSCTADSQCASGACYQSRCITCINQEVCKSSLGSYCDDITYHSYVPHQCLSSACPKAEVQCSGSWCYYSSCKIASGSACTANSQCASRLCSNGICKLEPWSPCNTHSQCASGMCSPYPIQECMSLPLGSLCSGSYQCNATSECSGSICKLRITSACDTNIQCASNYCIGGICR